MKENLVKILTIFLLISLISCAKNPDKNFEVISIDNGNGLIKINAEIADDEQEQMKGLMFREKLNENDGMFFVFENEQERTFFLSAIILKLLTSKTLFPAKESLALCTNLQSRQSMSWRLMEI